MNRSWFILGAGILVMPGGAPSVWAGAEKAFREGNRAYAEERFGDAVQAYQEAAAESTGAAAILFNQGAALYRQEQFGKAGAAFEAALATARTDILRSRSWYNRGNCMVKIVESLRQDDPQQALAVCREATWAYRAAIQLDPTFPDAGYNLEVSQRLAATLQEDIQKQEEEQNQDPDSPHGESDEDSDPSDDYAMDYSESDEDADRYEEADPFGDFSEYEEIRGVPPPRQTEADILAEELRNQEQRRAKRAAEYQAVEKDW